MTERPRSGKPKQNRRGPKKVRGVATIAGPTEREMAAAYAQDRSHQYTDKSSAKVALEDLAADIRNGEHVIAFDHGELDDLIAYHRKLRRAR